ncbi:MAG: SGNH/GDSL hydrolase family protein [Proteobacteria bacterium]|nr:SGNH/GDSL hydrolase family protein [Pseudomonadota bacterium]
MVVALILLASALALELVFELRAAARRKRAESRSKPYYPWAYYTRSGVRFAHWRGYLKLRLDPAMIYRNAPNQKTPYFTTNDRGYRGKALEAAPRRRIVLLGGSTAFGTGLDSDDETFAARLSGELGAEVVNAAVIGHRSGQELVHVATDLIDLKPQLILALDGWNDFSQLWISTFEHRPLGFNAFELLEDEIEASQKLLSAPLPLRLLSAHKFLFPALEREIQKALRRKAPADEPPGADWKVPLLAESYAANMAKISAFASARGARFLCALQPVRAAAEGREGRILPRYAEFRRLVKERFAAAGVPHVDLNDDRAELPDSRFVDLTHLNPDGHRALAKLVAAKLRAQGLA